MVQAGGMVSYQLWTPEITKLYENSTILSNFFFFN